MNRFQEALDSFRKAAKLDPDLAEARESANLLEDLGVITTSDISGAEARPDSPEALRQLKLCVDYLYQKSCRAALSIGLTPVRAARAWAILGQAPPEDLEDPFPEEALREALKLNPDYALAYYLLGGVLTTFSSENVLVVFTSQRLHVLPLQGDRIGEPFLHVPVPRSSRVVMVQWAVGQHVHRWTSEVRPLLVEGIPEPERRD